MLPVLRPCDLLAEAVDNALGHRSGGQLAMALLATIYAIALPRTFGLAFDRQLGS